MAHDIEGLTAAAICDALAKRHDHRAHILDLVTPTPGEVLFGQAATIRFFPNRRDHHSAEDRFDQLLQAVTGTGHVLVLGCGGHEDQALAGGKKVARIEAAGFAGLLTDGRLRDLEEIAGFDLVAYCGGETVRAAGDDVTPLAANVPGRDRRRRRAARRLDLRRRRGRRGHPRRGSRRGARGRPPDRGEGRRGGHRRAAAAEDRRLP